MTQPEPSQQPNYARRWKVNPFAAHVHLPPLEIDRGTARVELVVEEIHTRTGGLLHGGMVATLLDTVSGFAAGSLIPDTADVLTMQLNVNFTATAKLGERVIVTAKAIHAGRRTSVITAEIRLADGKLLAASTATMFIVAEGIVK